MMQFTIRGLMLVTLGFALLLAGVRSFPQLMTILCFSSLIVLSLYLILVSAIMLSLSETQQGTPKDRFTMVLAFVVGTIVLFGSFYYYLPLKL
jgi:hypothetical protein